MSNSNERDYSNIFPEPLANIFAQLRPLDVEQFYQAYQLWMLQKRIELQQLQIATLQEHIAENAQHMRQVAPSPLALSILAQLQAHGVDDVDLLDRMLERGESWLDNTMQLLEHCESLDMIQGDYNQWCENALEGAFNWITSMNEASQSAPSATLTEPPSTQQDYGLATEEMMLQRLMSEDGISPPSPTAQLETSISESLISEQEHSSPEQVAHPQNGSGSLEQISSEQDPLHVLEPVVADEHNLPDSSEQISSEQDPLHALAAIVQHNIDDDASAPATAEQETFVVSDSMISESSTIELSLQNGPTVQDMPVQKEESEILSNETTAVVTTIEQAQTDPAEITPKAVIHSTVASYTQTTDDQPIDLATQSTIEVQETSIETEEIVSDQDESEVAQIEVALVEAKIDTVPLDAISLEIAPTTITDVELTLIENVPDSEPPLIEETSPSADPAGIAAPEPGELVAETLDVQTIVEPLVSSQPEAVSSSELLESDVDDSSIIAPLEVRTQTSPLDEHREVNLQEQPLSSLYTETVSQQANSDHSEIHAQTPPIAPSTETTSLESAPLEADQQFVAPSESAPEALPGNNDTLDAQPETLASTELTDALPDTSSDTLSEETFMIKRNPDITAGLQGPSVSKPTTYNKNSEVDKDDTTILYALKTAPAPQLTDVLPVLKPTVDHKDSREIGSATQPLQTDKLPGRWEEQVHPPLVGDLPERPTLTDLPVPPIPNQMAVISTEPQQQSPHIVQQEPILHKKPGFWRRLWALLWG